jgi:hypothetical protein
MNHEQMRQEIIGLTNKMTVDNVVLQHFLSSKKMFIYMQTF